jgi:hypothetical protein
MHDRDVNASQLHISKIVSETLYSIVIFRKHIPRRAKRFFASWCLQSRATTGVLPAVLARQAALSPRLTATVDAILSPRAKTLSTSYCPGVLFAPCIIDLARAFYAL